MNYKVAIIGGGYAGFELAKALDSHVNVVLIEPREAFVHNVGTIRALVEPDLVERIIFPYDGLLRRGEVRRARAKAIDPAGVTLEDGTRIEADAIVVATGSLYASPFKPQGDSMAEFRAALGKTGAMLRAADQVVIVGGGAVGVELAGEIKAADPAKPVQLISGSDRLFPMYSGALHAKLARRLRRLGVNVHLGAAVSDLERSDAPYHGAVTLPDGRRLEGLVVPAIGSRIAEGPAHALPASRPQRNGQLGVDPWLRPSAHPRVFAIGDLAATGEGMTIVALSRQVPWLAATLRGLARGKKLEAIAPYKPWHLAPILLPLGPRLGASVLPLGKRGLVVGNRLTAAIKGRQLFIPRYEKAFGK